MIVSASYRTDIPALYGAWFQQRLAEGFCVVGNPYRPNTPPRRVLLTRDTVEGWVFWTKNLAPFWSVLLELDQQHWPFYVQFTITGTGRDLEPGVPNWHRSVTICERFTRTFGRNRLVWRYDPIVVSQHFSPEWHAQHFETLVQMMAPYTHTVVFSIAHPYPKIHRRMAEAVPGWNPMPQLDGQALLAHLTQLALQYGVQPQLCAQPEYLPLDGLAAARCVDLQRLETIAGTSLNISPARSANRSGCLCAPSIDIGAYDTCTQGCAYCYAVNSFERAHQRLRTHRPDDVSLDPSWAHLTPSELSTLPTLPEPSSLLQSSWF